MTFFSKSSILFCTVNLLRLLSVVAILLSFSGEVVTLVDDMKGYQSYEKSLAVSSPSPSPSASSALSAMASSAAASAAKASGPSVGSTIGRRHNKRERLSSSIASESTTAPTSTPTTAAPVVNTNCAYITNTSVPSGAGGVVFSALARIFSCLILLVALCSEMPPPVRFTQMFFDWAFPPFGAQFGVGVLGSVQVFLSSTILSHSTRGFPMVAAWMMFVVGFLNMLFGLALGAKIKSIRSIIGTASGPPSGLRSLMLGAEAHAGGLPSSNSSRGYHDMDSQAGSTKKARKPIIIGKPMMQAPAPPVYQPGGRH